MRNINWMRALRRLAIQGGLAPLAISSSFATSSSALTSTAVIAAISLSALQGCSPKSHPAHTPPLDKQRELDKESASVPELGQWLLSELLEVNGSAANAIELRQALLKRAALSRICGPP